MLQKIKIFFSNHLNEIFKDKALRLTGALFAFLQVLAAIYWLTNQTAKWMAVGSEAICWPIWSDCESWRILSESQVQVFFFCFGLLGLFTVFLFLKEKYVKSAYLSFLVLNLIKVIILCLDVRLRMNHHLMTFWLSFAFLFIQNKRKILQLLIVSFYLWAGFLKLNPEWLSGSALYGEIWFFHGASLAWACAYVVVLELVLIWLLLVKNNTLRWITWIQLIIFHTFSFSVVGFFYPMLMYSILLIFPLFWIFKNDAKCNNNKAAYLLLFIFTSFQLWPKFLSGDTAVTGEGRVLALNMFDSRTVCQVSARIKNKEGSVHEMNLRLPLPIRLHCDPIVYLSRARRLCRENKNSVFQNLDLLLISKRSDQNEMKPILDIKNFCSQNIEYNFFQTNDWILK